jgi:NAD(P)-dependent dehydrogenase (short-subunit alcohol dehydrogenase family)
MNCEGKVALVTGAAGSGLGRSIALTLAREGARVVVNYRSSEAAAREIVDHIHRSGGSAAAIQADVFDADACARLIEASAAHFGPVDIGIIGPGGGWHPEPLDTLDPGDALDDLYQETAPTLHLLSGLLPGMYERGWGRIIGIATHPVKLSPAYAYNLGKAARMQALLLAQDQAWPHGVTINVIAPGPVSSLPDLSAAADLAQHGPAWRERANVTPQDIAEGVAFLCSDAARFIGGSVLPYLFN